jgi:TonB-dependent starch-binding outer membrane protein SusC
MEKDTDNGTISDVDGKYTLRVSPDAKLVFTFIGYNKEEIRVEGTTSVLNIELIPDINSIDEIVVVC